MDFTALDRVGLLRVLQSLPQAKDVASLGATCSLLRDLARTDVLWAELLFTDLGLALEACPGQELQAVYCKLASFRREYNVRFLGAYSDGGCDNVDLTYWVDHVFMPNHWYPFCSESSANINCVGLLKANPHGYDEAAMQHRTYLIERCKFAAALLFGPQQPTPPENADFAVQTLSGWSMAGLERLFVDLYQDLAAQDVNSTWGRLLLRGVSPQEQERERAMLQAKFQYITSEGSFRSHYQVEPLPQDIANAIDAAAAAAASAAALPALGGAGRGGGAGGGAGRPPAAAAGVVPGASQAWRQGQQAQRRPRLFDRRTLPLFGSEELATTTAVVKEVCVSRCGHFTCPVRCGAVFLGQLPQQLTASDTHKLHALAGVAVDPMVAAFNDVTDMDALHELAQSGAVPAIVACHSEGHVEWAEFGAVGREQRRVRAAQGWHMHPVVWFRFKSSQELPASMVAALGEAEMQMMDDEPPYDDDEEDYDYEAASDDVSNDDDDDDDEGQAEWEAEDDWWQAQEEQEERDEQQHAEVHHGGAEPGACDTAADSAAAASDAAAGGAEAGLAAAAPIQQAVAALQQQVAAITANAAAASGIVADDAAHVMCEQQQQEQQRDAGQGHTQQLASTSSSRVEQQAPQPEKHAAEVLPMASTSSSSSSADGAAGDAGPSSAPQATSTTVQCEQAQAVRGAEQANPSAGTGDHRPGAPAAELLTAASTSTPQQQPQGRVPLCRAGSSRRRRRMPVDRAPGVRILADPCLPTEVRSHPLSLKVLHMRLSAPHSGNAALLKLISPENLMQEFGDDHDLPNVDCEYVAFKGFALQLPPGTRLL